MAARNLGQSIVEIQTSSPSAGSPSIPLILFHDGGGTIYQYFLLQSISRQVYGVQNPYFESGKTWASLKDMARSYVECIKTSVAPGPVILGGWSFGGHLSLEVAYMLREDDSGHEVIGMVFIDTSFPVRSTDKQLSYHKIPFHPSVPIRRRVMAQRCMDEAVTLLNRWQPPTWYKFGTHDQQNVMPPATVLLRAKDKSSLSEFEDPKLGWGRYDHDFIQSVIHIDGNHFNLFEGPRIMTVCLQLQVACNEIEASYKSKFC
ncbi:hypothetical protein WAI453_007434 [Rhynchosporium graminicola]